MAEEWHTTATKYSRRLSPPSRADYGNSRLARKHYRRDLDAYHKAERRESGRPAKAGPPIPGSQYHGGRRFYTLAQCRAGGRISGERRRARARPAHSRMVRLRLRGLSLREIGAPVGYHYSTVSRVLSAAFRGVARTEDTIPPRRPISPSYAKLLLWTGRLRGLVPAVPPKGEARRLYGRQADLLRWQDNRVALYARRMVGAGRSQLEASTRAFVETLRDLDALEAVHLINGYYVREPGY